VIDFYTSEEQRLIQDVERHSELALSKPLGMAFVTFPSLDTSMTVYEDHSTAFWSSATPPISSLTSLRPDKWKVYFAPPPSDIYWENLAEDRWWIWVKIFASDLCLFLVAFFLTTPCYIVSQLEPIMLAVTDDQVKIPSFVKTLIPTLILKGVAVLMPALVTLSTRFLGFWYRSEEHHSVMRKSFGFLLIVVILFPLFGFTTFLTVGKKLFAADKRPLFRWDCVFLPDSGAIFVNYVITAALIGNGLELVRFPDMIWYGIQVFFSRSKADEGAIQRAIEYEFRFGEQYARLLLVFAMVMMFSFFCPLITPFGLLYFILNYLVDKNNLALVYSPSKINQNIHRTAICIVVSCVLSLQVFMTIFLAIRGYDQTTTKFSTQTQISSVISFFSFIVFSARMGQHLCKKMHPINYVDVPYVDLEVDDDHQEVYIPEVLVKCYPKLEDEIRENGNECQ